MTKGFFDTDLKAFAGFGSPSETDNSWEISAQELLGALFGGNAGISSNYKYGTDVGMAAVLKRNLRVNGGMMLAQVIGIPIAFKYGRKLLGKTLIRPANRLLAPAGVKL